jgi:transposase InsO family protein
MDFFVVPTIGFKLLYGFVIMRLDRRDLVWINVTTNPTAEWVARQITEAFPWDEAPRHVIRDRDQIYGPVVTRRLRAMGIRDKPIAPASPWQNGFAERLIGSIRRECLDHLIVFGGASAPDSEILRRLLQLRQNASIFAQRCAGFSACSAIRHHKCARYLGRTSSSIRSDLDSRYTQGRARPSWDKPCTAVRTVGASAE